MVDLLNQKVNSWTKNPNNPHIEVMLHYYGKHPSHNKFEYDDTNSKWIDVDWVITTITINYNIINEVYTIDVNDSKKLFKFVT